MNNSITTTKSSGFSLIELLVVVAILGVVAAIGTVSYSGYVSSTERKSAENLMRQVALGQTEYYSENGIYFSNSGCGATTATVAHSKEIESDLTVGRVLVRPSGTENKIRVMVESDDEKTATKYAKDIATMFKKMQ